MKRIILFLSISILLPVLTAIAQPRLSSYPSAKATIFLDFDGHYVEATLWNGGKSFYCAPSGLTNEQITDVFHRVSEDFRPFDINITTDSTVYLAAPLNKRIRIVITPTSDWYQGVGGVSFTRSFTWGDGTPAFVFPDRLLWSSKIIAECCSHEAGHALGLSHQAKYNDNCGLVAVYHDGAGSGETGWAPVMGNSYNRNFSGWNNGPTPNGCYADQDNLSIITSLNGFGYREDDHSDDPRLGATKIPVVKNELFAEGIITSSNDKDAFEINFTEAGEFQLAARPFSVGPNNAGANLDVKLTLLNSRFDTIAVFDPKEKLDVFLEMGIVPGKYFVVVEGASNHYTSNYGSLGSYTISGTLRPMSPMSVTQLTLRGSSSRDEHKLVWDLICDESIADQSIEVSYDGKEFKNLSVLSAAMRQFHYAPMVSGEIYYRVKVVTASGLTAYSNVVSLKQQSNVGSITIKATMVTGSIEIEADRDYQFILSDLNGKILKKGNGTGGRNVINIANYTTGIYIVQIVSNSQKNTHRIVKL